LEKFEVEKFAKMPPQFLEDKHTGLFLFKETQASMPSP
jgi:hypothetical protein